MKKEIKIPKKITPDFIIDSVVEIRFKSSIPEEAIFGIIFNLLQNKHPNFKNAPIAPDQKRQNPNLQFFPDGTIYDDKFSVGINKSSISFSCVDGYSGWDDFFNIIKTDLDILKSKDGLILSIDRIGIRFINFFPNMDDIFKNFDVNFDFSNMHEYITKRMLFNSEVEKDGITFTLNVGDKIQLNNENVGVILDIDAFIQNPNIIFASSEFYTLINTIHVEENRLFYSLLNKDFLTTLNPIY